MRHACTWMYGGFASTLLGAGLLAAIGLAGCQSMGSTDSQAVAADDSPLAEPKQHPMLEGIPLPVGFHLIPERSSVESSGQIRWARCEFEGPVSADGVAKFYLNYMPSAHFTVRHKALDRGEYGLRFASDAEECNIRVRRDKTRTVLVIDLKPLPKGTAEHTSTPPAQR